MVTYYGHVYKIYNVRVVKVLLIMDLYELLK